MMWCSFDMGVVFQGMMGVLGRSGRSGRLGAGVVWVARGWVAWLHLGRSHNRLYCRTIWMRCHIRVRNRRWSFGDRLRRVWWALLRAAKSAASLSRSLIDLFVFGDE